MMGKQNICCSFLALTTILLCNAGLHAEQDSASSWLQWRGPNRDGYVAAKFWPESLAEKHLVELWSQPLAPSYSGPIITGNQVIVTETKSRSEERVIALESKTGKQLWETHWPGAMKVPFFAKANGDWIRATPACDGQRLYIAGMRDVLVCLDVSNGDVIWRVDFVKQTKSNLPAFGFVSSPLILGDSVFVQAGGGFAKLNKQTGKILWHVLKDGGGMFGSAFSSPFITVLHGEPVLLVQTRKYLAAVHPDDGATLWKKEIPAFRGMNILTPTVEADTIFTSSYGSGSLLLSAKKNKGDWNVTELWKNKVQGYMSTPVVIDGHLYLHLRNQRFACIEMASGKVKWTTKPYGKYWSLITNGKSILALDERGELRLIRANPEKFELLDTRKVAEDSWAHLAVSGSQLFIRDLNAIKAYQWK